MDSTRLPIRQSSHQSISQYILSSNPSHTLSLVSIDSNSRRNQYHQGIKRKPLVDTNAVMKIHLPSFSSSFFSKKDKR